MRGVWCQALSLPRPPVPWGGQPGFRFRDPCFPVAVGVGVGTQHQPHSVRSCGLRCALWGWREVVPGGGALRRFEGRLGSGALPPPAARPLGGLSGSATHVLWARVCGCGAQHCPVGLHALRRLHAAGVVGGRPGGAGLPTF